MTIDLNKGWFFCKEDGIPVETDLPHDAMLAEARDRICRNGVNTGYFPGGKYRYEKRFVLEEAAVGKSIVLHFEGVYQNCKVYLNGLAVGAHHYGYTAFDVDISNAVQAGENLLRVTVDNSLEPNCRWYSGSGIYRPVTMCIQDKNHISGVHLETLDIHPARVRAEITTTRPCDVTVEFYDGDTCVASGAPGVLEIPDAKLWSAENPYLYRVLVRTDTDEQTIFYGIRNLAWSAETGLTVNDKPVLLRGGCIHHDHGVLGACEYQDAEERRILVKDLSRFGRDYLTVGDYISRVFPFLGVRFISVNDGFFKLFMHERKQPFEHLVEAEKFLGLVNIRVRYRLIPHHFRQLACKLKCVIVGFGRCVVRTLVRRQNRPHNCCGRQRKRRRGRDQK